MRLIDADAIVYTHAIARSIDDGHNWNELCVTKDEIDDMPSVEPERKWIPCSERLPYRVEHRDDMVLVCYGNGSIRFDSCMNGEWVHGNPIAWMPLPEPLPEPWKGE